MNYFLTIALAFLSTFPLYGQEDNARYAEAHLTSTHLIPGEQAILWLSVQGGSPDGSPQAPEVEGAAINFIQSVTRIDNNRNLTQAYAYRVSAPNPGKYIIPPVTMVSGGKRLLTDPLVFHVHPTTSLKPIATGIPKNDVKIGWFPKKTTLYQGEVCPVTLKVYAPARLRVVSFGLPDPEKVNCLAWRFSLPNKRQSATTTLDGKTYQVVEYTTTLSGIAPGKATFGPTQLRLVVRQRTIDPRIGPMLSDQSVSLSLPALDFNILPLPAGAPAGFQGAIGNFKISAQCQKITLAETDSTEVILHVDGTGNLSSVKPPELSGADWKIIDTSKVTRGEERRFTTGRVTFRQLLRPVLHNESRTANYESTIPEYTFSYFDPRDQKYHTLNTPPIPVSITPVATSPGDTNGTPNKESPTEEMQDIMSFIDQPEVGNSKYEILNSKCWHLVPAAIAMLLIGIALRRRRKRHLLLHPDAAEKKAAIKKLSQTTDTRTFYRRAGRIIDLWHPGGANQQPQLQEILEQRDALCFQPEGSNVDALPADRKQQILNLLKRSTQLLIVLLTVVTTTGISAEPTQNPTLKTQHSSPRDAWKVGDYQQALDLYHKQYPKPNKTPADILYNIGNCHHRLGQPGPAALAWRRALLVDPSHTKARQNLRFTEISQGSRVPEHQPWQTHLAAFSSGTYYFTLYACAWTIALATLAIILFRKNKTILTLSIVITCLAGISATVAGFAAHYYPDAHLLAPPEQLAVVITGTPLYEDAHRTTTQNSKLAPASLLKVNAQRGPWTHVTLSDGKGGWVESKLLERIVE